MLNRTRPSLTARGLRRGAIVLAAVSVLGLVSCADKVAGSSAMASPKATPGLNAAIASFQQFASAQAENGDVGSLRYVLTDAGAAETFLYGSASADGGNTLKDMPVVVIVATGNFVASGMKVPPKVPTPTGPVLTAVVVLPNGIVSGGITDWGLDNTPPDIGSLGPVVAVRK